MNFQNIIAVNEKIRSLSLEEYADFIEFFMKDATFEKITEQKNREERIHTVFSFVRGSQKESPENDSS